MAEEAVQDEVKKGGQPPLMMAAVRLGGAAVIDEESGLEDAVKLSSECDATIVVIGTSMDWEAEAADRASLELPGETDELVRRILAVSPDAIIVNQSVGSFARLVTADGTSVQFLTSRFASAGISGDVSVDKCSEGRITVLVCRQPVWKCHGRCNFWPHESCWSLATVILRESGGLLSTSQLGGRCRQSHLWRGYFRKAG